MLSYFILVAVLVTCGGAATIALREQRAIAADVDAFVRAVDTVTADVAQDEGDSESPVSAFDDQGLPRAEEEEISTVIRFAIEAEEHALAILALNDLTSRAELARTRSYSFAKGLPRVCLLSGAGGAFLLAALGAFSRDALVLAGCSVGTGMMTAFVTQSACSRARRAARKYGSLTDVLAREVEGRFEDPLGGDKR